MNIEFFRESLELLSLGGAHMLNEEQKALLENSLVMLQSENKLHKIFFWGRIAAVDGDYYIACGYLKDSLRGRRFFFSKNCWSWYLLPPGNADHYMASLLAERPLSGDISEIHEVVMDPLFVTSPDGVVLPSKREVLQLKEEDRLALLVSQITEESALLPRGALTKRMDGKAVYTPNFAGLSRLEASKMDNYALYRTPRDTWNANLLKKPDYNYSTDIFDTIDSLVPVNDTFALNTDPNRGVVLIRSLYWPGMVFFHKWNSRKHGFAYFGDGRKNLDILFML